MWQVLPSLGLLVCQLAPAAMVQEQPVDAAAASEAPTWELSGSIFYSDPPGSGARFTPIVYADRGPLHLELRYGYEDDETASFFVGWSFAAEGEVEALVTPMLGAVAGETNGVAPGLELDVGWRRLGGYVEAEYLFDLEHDDGDFFYSWSTLTWEFTDWVRAGLVTERSRLVDTGLSVQRGLALELTRGSLGLSLYAYNLGTDDSYAVVALAFSP